MRTTRKVIAFTLATGSAWLFGPPATRAAHAPMPVAATAHPLLAAAGSPHSHRAGFSIGHHQKHFMHGSRDGRGKHGSKDFIFIVPPPPDKIIVDHDPLCIRLSPTSSSLPGHTRRLSLTAEMTDINVVEVGQPVNVTVYLRPFNPQDPQEKDQEIQLELYKHYSQSSTPSGPIHKLDALAPTAYTLSAAPGSEVAGNPAASTVANVKWEGVDYGAARFKLTFHDIELFDSNPDVKVHLVAMNTKHPNRPYRHFFQTITVIK